MHAYTLAFIKRNQEVLLLNRNKSPWMGSWNGVGGKIQSGESPLHCIRREILEETGIDVSLQNILEKGELTWERFEAIGGGLYLFVVEMDPSFEYHTPRKTEEGILDWKPIDWAVDMRNEGIARNIPHFLPSLLYDQTSYLFHCVFKDGILESVAKQNLEDL